MKFDLSKINWQKVITIGSCILTGVIAFQGAVEENKQSEKVENLEKRIADLEQK